MSDEQPSFVADLLRAERAAPPVDRAIRSALRSRLAVDLGFLPHDPSGASGGHGAGGGPAAGPAASAGPGSTGAVSAHGTAAAVVTAKASLLGGPVALALAFAAGVAGGAGGYAVLDRDPPASRVAAPPVTPPTPALPAPAVVAPAAVIPPTAETAPSPPAPPALYRPARQPVSAGPDRDLAHERDLLEGARTALGRGDPGGALRQLGRHVARFPDGRLVEEREALRIQALAATGDRERATAAAAGFRRRFPSSLFSAAVAEALEGTP